MSVDYRTEIVYGVLLDKNEINILNQKDDEFRDTNCNFIHIADCYSDASDIVIGVEIGGSIEEGTSRKISLPEIIPEMDKVENILRELGVTREFAWYAIHCVS